MPDSWLSETRTCYDTDASGYADKVRGLLDNHPYLRASLALFAESVRIAGGGPVADVGCGPGYVTGHLHDLGVEAFGVVLSPDRRGQSPPAPRPSGGWLREAGFTIDAELLIRPDEDVPGAVIFARSRS